jgi:hypothetical protein
MPAKKLLTFLAGIALVASVLTVWSAPRAQAVPLTDPACASTPTHLVSNQTDFLAVPAGASASSRSVIKLTYRFTASQTIPIQAHTVVIFNGFWIAGGSAGPTVEVVGDDVHLCNLMIDMGTPGLKAVGRNDLWIDSARLDRINGGIQISGGTTKLNEVSVYDSSGSGIEVSNNALVELTGGEMERVAGRGITVADSTFVALDLDQMQRIGGAGIYATNSTLTLGRPAESSVIVQHVGLVNPADGYGLRAIDCKIIAASLRIYDTTQLSAHITRGGFSGYFVGGSFQAENATIALTGSLLGTSQGDGLKLIGGTATLRSFFEYGSTGHGLHAIGTAVTIIDDGTTFVHNTLSGARLAEGATLTGQRLTTYSNGGDGILVDHSTATLENFDTATNAGFGAHAINSGRLTVNSCMIVTDIGAGRSKAESNGVITEKCGVKVAVSPASATVITGKSLQLTAKVTLTDNIEYTGLTQPPGVTWSLSGQKHSGTKIDANGKLTIHKDESAATLTVTATTKTDKSFSTAVKGSAKIAVKPFTYIKLVKAAQKSLTLVKGKSATIPTHAYTNNAGYNDPLTVLTWKSSNTSVATVDKNGRITAKKAGSATITATAKGKGYNNETMRLAIPVKVVTKAVKVKTAAATSMPKQLKVEAKDHIWGITTPAGATGLIATFTSSNSKVLTVGPTGILHARKAGTAKITVKMGTVKRIYTVKVVK